MEMSQQNIIGSAVGPVGNKGQQRRGIENGVTPQQQMSTGNVNPTDLASFFECPVCFDYVRTI
jgi:hypothetical protein